jgi:hypothetical protein
VDRPVRFELADAVEQIIEGGHEALGSDITILAGGTATIRPTYYGSEGQILWGKGLLRWEPTADLDVVYLTQSEQCPDCLLVSSRDGGTLRAWIDGQEPTEYAFNPHHSDLGLNLVTNETRSRNKDTACAAVLFYDLYDASRILGTFSTEWTVSGEVVAPTTPATDLYCYPHNPSASPSVLRISTLEGVEVSEPIHCSGCL